MVQAHPEVMNAAHHPGFFQRKSVQNTLPFLTSLAFHAGLVVLAATLYKAVTVINTITEKQGPVAGSFDPVAEPVQHLNPGIHGVGTDVTRRMAQNLQMEDTDPSSKLFKPSAAAGVSLDAGGSNGTDAALIGMTGTLKAGRGTGRGVGDGWGDGFGTGPQGKATSFGPPSDGAPGPFEPTLARRVVYVCDATGSMTSVFSGLRRELTTAVDKLGQNGRVQFFNILFFSDDRTLSFAPQLVKADPAGKAKAAAFTNDATPRGLTNPLPAIRAAFAQDPEVIYVLTDGFDQVNDLSSVVKEFDALNKDRKVRVNTILIGTGEQKELVDALKTIAEKNNGTMKIVSKEDF